MNLPKYYRIHEIELSDTERVWRLSLPNNTGRTFSTRSDARDYAWQHWTETGNARSRACPLPLGMEVAP